ncbi:benzoate-CoA ligase family protein [Falsiruegeria mediterranea]|uniref:4-hydroxybenzoate--CoA/benzoate--CoA ligase n=1 Tax=Falsiruegeria mediterranea M17 TaxID=1200281 RepID=A0A2R8C489_9RHOB|nr:benzoate-CoA ligase family protein [Falsiruegeria mediterranea]SPJ27143.1 4-hydroxybenzoate--CoA/benzoate--CoA ligase [Falsiruegeria mediterranea M17]
MSGNAAQYFVDRHVNEGRGDRPAFREAGGEKRSLTYGALADGAGVVASALTRAGIPREARAVMLVLDQIEFPQIFWGCMRAGVVPVPLNTLLAAPVYKAILEDSRATILFVSQELWPVVEPAARASSHLSHIVVIGDAPEGTGSYADFTADCAPSDTVDASEDDVAFWLYSSGSTGQPKGVRHVHGSLKATADTYGAQVLQIEPGDVVYSAAKLFFAYGLGNAMTFPMSVGAETILFNGRPTPEMTVQILRDEKPTVFCGVPTLYAATVALLEQGDVPDTKLRRCISAGEALPEDIGTAWRGLWGTDILDGVGSTEMLHIFLSNAPDDVAYGTSGRPVPGYDVRLVDEDGNDVPVGGLGELLVRGASAADGYWNKRDKSRATFEGEWTRTGDKYELTESGRYVYCGRTDDMFKVSGIWVSPFEVEQALSAHPAVLEAAVVPMRDEQDLEKPKAFIVLKQDVGGDLTEELQTFVKDKVGKWKYPRWIDFVDDLPKTATGKIQRFKLREG